MTSSDSSSIKSKQQPVPMATHSSADSATCALMCSFSSISSSNPRSNEPPPVITAPDVKISPTSSGGVRSRTDCIVPTICCAISKRQGRSSAALIRRFSGRPVVRLRPFTSNESVPGSRATVPISRFDQLRHLFTDQKAISLPQIANHRLVKFIAAQLDGFFLHDAV